MYYLMEFVKFFPIYDNIIITRGIFTWPCSITS